MVLKFDDVIYQRTFEIQAKDKTFTVVVEITDEESVKMADIAFELLKGNGDYDELNKILFKDQYDKIKEVLIGFNFNKFQTMVMSDYQNFTQGSIDEAINNLKKQ